MINSQVPFTDNPDYIKFASSLIEPLREPVLVINSQATVIAVNEEFSTQFAVPVKELWGQSLFKFMVGLWENQGIRNLYSHLEKVDHSIRNYPLTLKTGRFEEVSLNINGTKIPVPGEEFQLYLLSFEIKKDLISKKSNYQKLLNEILSEAPAIMCTLRGPDHIYELANDKYLQLVGHRDIIGKKVKDALPEVENQGFIDMLDNVYKSGEPFIGKEIPLDIKGDKGMKQSLLDFVYQPIKNLQGNVEGIFVHAIDVTQKVQNRRSLEDSERELKNLIDTVPAMIWLSNSEGEASYLNESWYRFTGQVSEEPFGSGWLQAVHPEDRRGVEKETLDVISKMGEIHQSFRLKNSAGEYRWVINKGRPKFDSDGKLQGYVGNVLDVHEERVKEQVIREKEHRTRSIVEEATIATAVYTGKEMKIELANDVMINVWGKDRSVVGKPLKEALPELEGQPFHGLLQKVYTTGETYWGKEDQVNLERNGKLETSFFNFTYKPLRNEKGEIYGILNMALEVTEMIKSRNILKERERHYRLMADLMPEKVINTNASGEAIYFNRNWLEYSGLSSDELKRQNWKSLIYPEDQIDFETNWQKSLDTGASFEMELRIKNRKGDYLWHLSRAEAVKDQQGQITMWIGTNTEIQRIKEEEKRKGDFLKMVSHELKTPVTSIKGYVQLLLKILKQDDNRAVSQLPVKSSLKRIDSQIVRLTRLISEMLDLSRLEENKLELQKEVFSINNLVIQTVQDIQLTNTQHEIKIFHSYRGKVFADKHRIGQVLINFITNAIKYSPESQYSEIHIEQEEEGEVKVSVRDKGIGIEEKDQRNIFKRFYRIGGENEDTYAGFGIGLYIAKEIIQRHRGSINVKSEKGKGSDFSFSISEALKK